MELDRDAIASGILEARRNTWGSQYHPTVPTIRKEGAVIKIIDGETVVEINSFDEIVLTIIMKFCFCPIWLVKQFYGTDSIISGYGGVEAKIRSWIRVGLVYAQNAVTGAYIRPTYQLFKLFDEAPYPYTAIPFNMLTHTITEEHVVFEIMTGRSKIVQRERKCLLPRVSELGFDDDPNGTNVLAEEDFRNPKLYTEEGLVELSATENAINNGMRTGAVVTPELKDFRQFVLVKKVDKTGVIKKDYKFHVPDLIIPCLREMGRPKSIAIEMELSNKRSGYVETMQRYKDNNKYGSVYWMCSRPETLSALRDAYSQVGGTGSTKTYLMEYVVPTPEGGAW